MWVARSWSFTAVSWAKLREVACLHKHTTGSLCRRLMAKRPPGFYHRECYKVYTQPSSLDNYSTNQETLQGPLSALDEDSQLGFVAELTSSSSNIIVTEEGSNVASTASKRSKYFMSMIDRNLYVHIMCQKSKGISTKDRHWRDPLTKCTQIQPTALVNAARLRQHESLLLHFESTGMDGVAADVNACTIGLATISSLTPVHWRSWKIQQRKYTLLLSEVESLVLTCKKLSTKCLCWMHFALFADPGINEEYWMEKVKRHFWKRFGDASNAQVLTLCGSCS